MDVKETSLEFLQENFIKVMDKARERDKAMRIERGLDIEGEYKELELKFINNYGLFFSSL